MKNKIFIMFMGIIMLFPVIVNAESIEVTLSKCVDGDTAKFNVDGKVKSTRFLAIDTPESVHPTKGVEPYGKEASSYTCKKLTNAKKIVLEYDDNSTKTDKYDRVLAWVFVDGKLMQEDLVSKGYAKVAYLYNDYKYTNLLQKKEKTAQNKKLRIWSDDVNTASTTTSNSSNNTKKTVSTTNSSSEDDELYEILKKIIKKVLNKIENML